MGTDSNNGNRKQRAIGRRIREARRQLALTGPQLADLLRISANHLYVLERGERPVGPKTMNRLARVTGRSVLWFLTGKESP